MAMFVGTAKNEQANNIPAVTPTPISNKRVTLIRELKARYKKQYDAVQPIPYIRDRLYCVDRVFVEGGIRLFAGSWISLDSYHSVFNNRQVESKRRILLGEAGYGKSTLTLQYAYDWCNSITESYLKDVEILILLRLRQLGGVHSIHTAIKRFLLPRNSELSESDIKSELENSNSVVVILDGFDEYPDQGSGSRSDIIKIIISQMFIDFEVILTTRYLPKEISPNTKNLRLIGFDDKARDEYIRKAVVGSNIEAANSIKQKLQNNPVLNDLCQVPLFFVMFAHMSHENKEFQTFKTVTSFFQYMIKCFHGHMRNKMKDKNAQMFDLHEEDHRKLDRIAFEGLSKKDQQIVWKREEIQNRLGHDFYDQYIRIGILVEEYDVDDIDRSANLSSDRSQGEVRFYHKLFCEWFAAYFLANTAKRLNVKELKSLIKNMDPFDLQYCYRFACGLNNTAASNIIHCLKESAGGDKFAILCIFEQGGKFDDILDTVKDLCSKQIKFKSGDNKLLQRSIVQLLEIASGHQISISRVYLDTCYSTVYLSGGYHLQLKSNLHIPVLTTLNELWIVEGGEDITEDFTDILQYSSKCLALKELWFYHCLLPQSVQAESVSILRSRNVEVLWYPTRRYYRLNLESRHWEHYLNGRVMTDEDYQSVVEEVREFRDRKQ